MKNKRNISVLALMTGAFLAGCAGQNYGNKRNVNPADVDTPTVDYVERLDVYSASHQDSFLNQLAMNYRSYAIHNARTSGYPDIGELFAQKAVSAFSGEVPYPESLDNWDIESSDERFEIHNAYNRLINELQNDAHEDQPMLAAEAQAKFDCWISAASSGQNATADECKKRFNTTLQTMIDCADGRVVAPTRVKSQNLTPTQVTDQYYSDGTRAPGQHYAGIGGVTQSSGQYYADNTQVTEKYYPETHRLSAMAGSSRTREGVIIVNNVNIPENLVNPVPVPQQPSMVFNQNIYGGDENQNSEDTFNGGSETYTEGNDDIPQLGDEYVKRDEFINLMNAMRAELAAINKRLDELNNKPGSSSEKTVIKVQQIPTQPKQHVMEEIFEIRFDFDKAIIKPEYDEIIKKLAATTQANKNVKVSVVGHTDTMGSAAYNYALGGRRAEAVQKMLIEYGIPASQIIAVSAGEEDLKIPTPDNTRNAENRRVRVVKETEAEESESAQVNPIVVEKYREIEECSDCETEEEE